MGNIDEQNIINAVEYCIARDGKCGGCIYRKNGCELLNDAEPLFKALHHLKTELEETKKIKRIGAYKVLSDETLKGETKADLIERIRILEHNWSATEESLNNSAKNGAKIIAEQKAEIERLTEEKNDILFDFKDRVTSAEQENAELQKQVDELKKRLHWIWAIGVDYDGCDKAESLKELIDEMVQLTQIESKDLQVIECHGMLKGCDMVKQAVKDTAKEILQELWDETEPLNESHKWVRLRIKNIASRKGVEVE